jgi:putative FmdB family regulatory protein
LPTYGYKCTACAFEYEKREGFDAPARQKCPKCKKQSQRMLFAPAVVFNGSGFYKTDSRSEGAKSGSDSSAATPSAPAEKPAADAGHTHGPGGHSHDAPAAPAAAPAKKTTTTEAAAAS